jgi:hypothetical protein
MSEPKGALFMWHDEPHITGFMVIGGEEYELVGVRRSKVRVDLHGRKKDIPRQADMFDDGGSGDGAG